MNIIKNCEVLSKYVTSSIHSYQKFTSLHKKYVVSGAALVTAELVATCMITYGFPLPVTLLGCGLVVSVSLALLRWTWLKSHSHIFTDNKTFLCVTRYLPNWQDIIIEARSRRKEIGLLCMDLQAVNWSGIISRYKKGNFDQLAKDALKAFHDNQITMQQFCTLTYCWSMLSTFPCVDIHIQPLFLQNGDRNPVAERAIKESFYREDSVRNFFMESELQGLCDRFFDAMKTKPASEQVFFYINNAQIRTEDPKGFQSIRDYFHNNFGFRAISCFREGMDTFQMIPTFSMIEACVDAYGRENTIAPAPTIGISQRMDLLHNLTNKQRDIATPFPGVPTPKTADGLDVRNFFEFLLHDIYHCCVVSQVPEPYRQETARVAERILLLELEISQVQDKDSMATPWLKTAFGRMIDLEFGSFRLDTRQHPILKNASDIELYLYELQSKFAKTTPNRMILKMWEQERLKRNELSPSQLEILREWDPIRPSKYSIDDPQFRERLDRFEATILPKLAQAMVNDGFLSRLQITEQNLRKAHGLENSVLKNSLLIELLKFYR